MTEEQLNKQKKQQELKASADKPPEKKRRRLIKGAAAAIPVVMTLHSGAALARTSNLMGPELNIGEAELFEGNLICVVPSDDCGDPPCGTDLGNGTVDLGNFPTAHYDDTKKDGVPDLVMQAQICETRQGFLVSATGAWASVAPKTGVPTKFI